MIDRRGLSLIELLAAVVVLSLVAAAGVGIVRETSAARDAWRHRQRAAEIIELWRADASTIAETGAQDAGWPIEWRHKDDDGLTWVVTAGAQTLPPEHSDDPRRLRIARQRITLERTGADGTTVELASFPRFVAPSADPSQEGTRP